MGLSRIQIEKTVGETRAVAVGDDDRPFDLFVDRWGYYGQRTRWQDRGRARLTTIAPSQGGAFAELGSGEVVFVALKDLGDLSESVGFQAETVAEARRGKLARVRPTSKEDDGKDVLTRWIDALPQSGRPDIMTTVGPDEHVADGFDDALRSTAVLPGGGVLHFTRAPALLAVDVDTAGRNDKGRASVRAKAVNVEAASELARHLVLRGFGGGAVLDCISPIAKPDRAAIKQAFLDAFRSMSTRQADALAPSPFGLMEIATAWRHRPIEDYVIGEDGTRLVDDQIVDALRALEREAIQHRTSTLRLILPKHWSFPAYDARIHATKALHSRYGARIEIVDDAVDAAQITTL